MIHVFDGHGNNKEIALLDSLHSSPLTFMEVWQHGGMAAWRYGMEVLYVEVMYIEVVGCACQWKCVKCLGTQLS